MILISLLYLQEPHSNLSRAWYRHLVVYAYRYLCIHLSAVSDVSVGQNPFAARLRAGAKLRRQEHVLKSIAKMSVRVGAGGSGAGESTMSVASPMHAASHASHAPGFDMRAHSPAPAPAPVPVPLPQSPSRAARGPTPVPDSSPAHNKSLARAQSPSRGAIQAPSPAPSPNRAQAKAQAQAQAYIIPARQRESKAPAGKAKRAREVKAEPEAEPEAEAGADPNPEDDDQDVAPEENKARRNAKVTFVF